MLPGFNKNIIKLKLRKGLVLLFTCLFFVSGCASTIPSEALQWNQESLKFRNLQTRKFDTMEESKLLQASAGVLQDLGFNIDESETPLGVLVASKDRDATETGQIVGAVVMAILFGVYTPVDEKQKIRASIVTRPLGQNGTGVSVRVTFQRIVWNTQKQVSKTEPLDDPKAYQKFFEKLSKAVFLEAHEI